MIPTHPHIAKRRKPTQSRWPDPTPEQIRHMCEEIQRTWSPNEKLYRRTGLTAEEREDWTAQEIEPMRRRTELGV